MGSSDRERLLGVPGAVSSSVRQLLTPAEAVGGDSPVAAAAPEIICAHVWLRRLPRSWLEVTASADKDLPNSKKTGQGQGLFW